jgi:hypothetical protein
MAMRAGVVLIVLAIKESAGETPLSTIFQLYRGGIIKNKEYFQISTQ